MPRIDFLFAKTSESPSFDCNIGLQIATDFRLFSWRTIAAPEKLFYDVQINVATQVTVVATKFTVKNVGKQPVDHIEFCHKAEHILNAAVFEVRQLLLLRSAQPALHVTKAQHKESMTLDFSTQMKPDINFLPQHCIIYELSGQCEHGPVLRRYFPHSRHQTLREALNSIYSVNNGVYLTFQGGSSSRLFS